LIDICTRLLEGAKYWGLSGIEMKKDDRDGEYKLVEINARYGLWDALGTRIGVDAAYTAYKDILSMPVEATHGKKVGVKWINLGVDIRTYMRYRQEGLSFSHWLTSLKGEKMWGDMFWFDPLPTLYVPWTYTKAFVRAVKRRFAQKLKHRTS